MTKLPRIILLGLDGTPCKLIKTYIDKGLMPNLEKIVKKGSLYQMDTVLPEISAPAWSSFVTGKNPAKTGVFGFFDLKPGTYQNVFTNYLFLKALPVWHIIHKELRKSSVVINMPSTFPAQPINGALISGFISTDLKKSVYPVKLLPLLEQMNYVVDLDTVKIINNRDCLFDEANKALDQRVQVHNYLWDKLDWQMFSCVITGTDRVQHFAMDAFENDDHPHKGVFENYYRRIDDFIGQISDKLAQDDVFILLSDHGFEVIDFEVYLNTLFRQKDWLEDLPAGEKCFESITDKTKVFCLDPARIYINQKSRYPNGHEYSVEDYNRFVDEIKHEIANLKTPDGKQVAKHIYKKEEVYSGKFMEYAPDLVVVPEEGFVFKGAVNSQEVFVEPKVHFGGHNAHDAFVACNYKMTPQNKPNIMDLTPTILNLLGVDISKYDFDGVPINIDR